MTSALDLLPAATPAWCEATTDTSVGVDFLGTRQANLNMLRELTGVYNNQLVSARQHAIVCWAAWRFLKNTEGRKEVTRAEFLEFLETVETIQVVGQAAVGEELGSYSGGLGSQSLARIPEGPAIPLRFEAYGRTHETSALAAVQYGPSARAEGLGLLNAVHRVPVATAERGEPLALALDGLLRASPAYHLLTGFPAPLEMSREDAIDLARHGLVIVGRDGAPRPEREVYIRSLFGLDGLPAQYRQAETMALILEWASRLDAGEGVTPGELRAYALAWRPDRDPLPEHLSAAAYRWRILQARQIQRFALDSWLGIAERWMDSRIHDVHGMLEEVDAAVAGGDLASVWAGPASGVPEDLRDPMLWAAGGGAWKTIRDIEAALKKGDTRKAVPGALLLTLACCPLFDAVVPNDDDSLRLFAADGQRPRVSLVTFRQWWRKRSFANVRDVIGDLLQELVLQQHVAIAVFRYDNEKRRLRFSTGERGWELLPGTKPTKPVLLPDRLAACAAMLNDLALLREIARRDQEPAYGVTDEGREVAREFAALRTGRDSLEA